MTVSIAFCLVAFAALLMLLRIGRMSFGLPIAFLGLLLFNHVPGAYAHIQPGRLFGDELTAIGIGYTAVAAVCFVIGAALAILPAGQAPLAEYDERRRFAMFCLVGGWFVTYGLTPLRGVPSLGAAIDKGAAIWLLGVLLGLRASVWRGDVKSAAIWGAALLVYPIMMLLLGGFLSYGSTAIIIVASVLAVSVRSHWRALAGTVVSIILCMSLFVNYFGNRDQMRATVWTNAGMSARIDANLAMFTNFKWFDATNPRHLNALDQRLNQNLFMGMAQKRLEAGSVEYLHGRSMSDAVLSLVPRALWPSKPVFGGSPKIVSDMTGLRVNSGTSFGVGPVMELQINFGLVGVALGFLGLGWLVTFLDRKAAEAERRGNLGRTMLFFLPAAALIQPLGSMVELAGGAAAAIVAALGWRWAWATWGTRPQVSGRPPRRRATGQIVGGPPGGL